MKKVFFSRMAITMMVAAQFLASCSKDDNNEQPTPPNEQPKHGEVINQEAAEHGYMVLKREDDASLNRTWDCTISCGKDDPNVWIDFNNNGKKDEKEAITSFAYYEFEENYMVNFPVSSGVIVVYGKVTKFGCAANNLTALEVSENTNLVELDCSENQLTALDVTKNTNLFTLGCSNNKINGLDVTKNIKLGYLSCYVNSLTELDITKNEKLQYLGCYGNKFDKTNMEKIIAALPNYKTGLRPEFWGWGENENNYKSEELRDQLVGKGWEPYHYADGGFIVWK